MVLPLDPLGVFCPPKKSVHGTFQSKFGVQPISQVHITSYINQQTIYQYRARGVLFADYSPRPDGSADRRCRRHNISDGVSVVTTRVRRTQIPRSERTAINYNLTSSLRMLRTASGKNLTRDRQVSSAHAPTELTINSRRAPRACCFACLLTQIAYIAA